MIPASSAASRITLLSLAIGLAAALIAVSGCGGDSAAKAGNTPVSSAEKQAPKATEKPSAPLVDRRCANQLDTFLATMGTLRERLLAGLSYEEYVGEIGVVRTAYDQVPIERLRLPCLAAAGTPGERAFDKYIDAANQWGACIEEEDCDAAKVEPALQKRWRGAASYLDEAQAGLGA